MKILMKVRFLNKYLIIIKQINSNYLGPSPKRTLISRQNLIKTKSPVRILS